MDTLYQCGQEAILALIQDYLELLESTNHLMNVSNESFSNENWRFFLLCGRGVELSDVPDNSTVAKREYEARSAIPHDLAAAVSAPLYFAMRAHAKRLVDEARRISRDFNEVSADALYDAPELLPAFTTAAGIFSKSDLQKAVKKGTVADSGISRPASERLAELLRNRFPDPPPTTEHVVGRMASLIEGQVRDLLGRHLLEALVEAALTRRKVPFVRENEYDSLGGVIYDHRADFVVPNADDPKLFIEVRKSSARHSSLYAKDKMFSAINWKGKHPGLIGVLVKDGEWSRESLLALARVFDYVLPVNEADELARVASAYLDGDTSVLRWIIHFSIERQV